MKTRTILTAFLVAIATSPSIGIATANVDQTGGDGIATLLGDAEPCTCQGAGRVATCPPPCSCDFDWQGYPRCTSSGGTNLGGPSQS